jgi:hypothetical protein
MEFTGVSLFVLGSYILFTEVIKRKVKAAEHIARDGFFRYLWKTKIKKEGVEGTNKLEKPATRSSRDSVQKRNYTAQQLIAAANIREAQLSCLKYFAR